MLRFAPVSLHPTRRRHRSPISGCRAEHAFDQPGHPGCGLGELMDVDALGEGAAVGVAQLGGDDAGWFLVGRHRRGQGMAQQVRVGDQADAGGEAGEGAEGPPLTSSNRDAAWWLRH
jgi:hypothetical protein